jgi:hypothetical protein
MLPTKTPRKKVNMKTVKILVPFRLEIDHKAVEFEPGVAELPDEAVDAFLRARYIALIEDAPAIKIVGNKASAKVKAVK